MDQVVVRKIASAVEAFCVWLARYGEVSHDHQSFYASKLGRAAKALYYRSPLLGTLAVSPMVFSEAFVPSARRFFYKTQRFPIADAHYAMGFAFLAKTRGASEHHDRAVHFLEVLQQTRCKGYVNYGWGYPFDWETRNGTLTTGTPMITTLPYVYEAFAAVYEIDQDPKWLEVMRSIADHGLKDYKDIETQPGASSCAYTPAPDDPCGVVNASAYRAFLLTKAGIDFSEPRYAEVARRNLNFVLSAQNPDGSWFYSIDGTRDFVDHFHTCFVLKALAKIEALTGDSACRIAIEKGVDYYANNLVDTGALPVPFSKAPRMTVYRRELYDFAESINLGVLLQGRFPAMDRILDSVVSDLLKRWRKRDGSFRARELLVGWDNVPMHRWAQSQMFRSLCFLLSRNLDSRDVVSQPEESQLSATVKH